MTIRDIMTRALRYIGREDIAVDIEDGGEPWGDDVEVVTTLLYCVNAVEDELARYYFPLEYTEELSSGDKLFTFDSFSHTPVKIIRVVCGGKEIAYEVTAEGITADAETVEITYHYAPPKKEIDDDSEFGATGDGNITALGAAAEYCLICGEASLAEVWETRYREAIDRVQSQLGRSAFIPPRRWI